MALTSFAGGCFYSSPQLVPPPTYAFKTTESVDQAASSHRKQLPQRKASAQLVALSDGWEPAGESRDWRYIVIHHTATATGDVESIDAAHRSRTDDNGRPWLGVGYHFVIGNGQPMADGEVAATFRWRDQLHGAHAGNRLHNEAGIGICLVGDFEQASPTARQMSAARRLVQSLTERYGIPQENILPHSQVTATECPGKHFPWNQLFEPQAEEASASWQEAELPARKRTLPRDPN